MAIRLRTKKSQVIIGGTSGMGLATAKMLLDGGARVLVTGRSQAGLESAQKEIGKHAIVVSSDARSLTDIDALASRVKAEFGTFDLLSVSAGFSIRAGRRGWFGAENRRKIRFCRFFGWLLNEALSRRRFDTTIPLSASLCSCNPAASILRTALRAGFTLARRAGVCGCASPINPKPSRRSPPAVFLW